MDKLTSIKTFTKVVQHGSFAAAARELRLSRSAVSKYVIELEQELGSQLLVEPRLSRDPAPRLRSGRRGCTHHQSQAEEERRKYSSSCRHGFCFPSRPGFARSSAGGPLAAAGDPAVA